MDRRFEAMQEQMDRRFEALTDDVGILKGSDLERRYRDRAYAYFAPLLRRARLLAGDAVHDLLERGVEEGHLARSEADAILAADLIVAGRDETGADIYLVVEISWGVGEGDVERASERAGLLAKAGHRVVGVVAGRHVLPDAEARARELGVRMVTDGAAVG